VAWSSGLGAVKRLFLRRGGQGPNWAVEPYDDDDENNSKLYFKVLVGGEVQKKFQKIICRRGQFDYSLYGRPNTL
jgi:hypothetical protein